MLKKVIGFCLMLIVLAGCNGDDGSENEATAEESSGETITLALAGAHGTSHSYHLELLQPFMDRVTELTDGRVEFEYYPGEQLGSAADLLDLASDGTADIAFFASPYYPSKMPIGGNLVGMPRLIDDSYTGSVAYHKVSLQSPVLDKDFLANGVRPVVTFVSQPYQFYTGDFEIKTPEDLKGVTVRGPGGIFNELLEYLGATPVSITSPEIYESFDRGVIRALYAAEMSLHDISLGELIGFATLGVNYGTASTGFIMNEEKYQSLPSDIQEAIDQAGEEITESYSKFIIEETENALSEWEATGTQIYEMMEEELAEWDKAANEFNEMWIEQQDSEEFIEAYELLVNELNN